MDPLKNLRIATPCPASWESMAGDERVRHCSLCKLNVYNVSEMTRDEVRDLFLHNEGRACIRLYRRADGTILTRDCPAGLRALRRRASRVAAATIAAMLSFPSFAFGGTRGSKVRVEVERAAAPQKAVFTGEVLISGIPLPGATIVVRSETGTVSFTRTTDANGAFTVPSLDDGLYSVEVTMEGLKTAVIKHLQLRANEVTKARFTMKLDATVEQITVGGGSIDPLGNGVSTWFSQDFINKLPH